MALVARGKRFKKSDEAIVDTLHSLRMANEIALWKNFREDPSFMLQFLDLIILGPLLGENRAKSDGRTMGKT